MLVREHVDENLELALIDPARPETIQRLFRLAG